MEQSTAHRSHEIRGLALAITSVLCFATTSILLSYANTVHGVDSWVASAYRGLVGLIVILTMQGSTGKFQIHHILTNRLLFIRGLLGGATIPAYYICIMELGPGRAGLIGGSYPLFAAIFAMILIKEGLNRSYFVYIGLAMLGLVGIFAEAALDGGKPLFDLLSIGTAAAGGLCVVMIRHLRHSESTTNIFAAQCVFTVIIAVFMAGDRILNLEPLAFGFCVLAAITVVGGQLSITESFRYINVARGSTLQMLTPALTVTLSAALLGEQFALLELVGGVAILYASYRIVVCKI